MPSEATKLRERWKREGLWDQYFKSGLDVLDVGAGDDLICPDARRWDREDGDAQYLVTIPNASYDIVFSAHCLEHMRRPKEALANWWRVLRPMGHLIFEVPDEDLYEQGVWPSRFNDDHKYTFNIFKDLSWSPCPQTMFGLLNNLEYRKVLSIRTIDTDYRQDDKIWDRTSEPTGEAAIEVIIQKCTMQFELMTNLKNMYRCPTCHWNELIVRGETAEGKLMFLCHCCGQTGFIKTDFSVNA